MEIVIVIEALMYIKEHLHAVLRHAGFARCTLARHSKISPGRLMSEEDYEIPFPISPVRHRVKEIPCTEEDNIAWMDMNAQTKLWEVEVGTFERANVYNAGPCEMGVIGVKVARRKAVVYHFNVFPKEVPGVRLKRTLLWVSCAVDPFSPELFEESMLDRVKFAEECGAEGR